MNNFISLTSVRQPLLYRAGVFPISGQSYHCDYLNKPI